MKSKVTARRLFSISECAGGDIDECTMLFILRGEPGLVHTKSGIKVPKKVRDRVDARLEVYHHKWIKNRPHELKRSVSWWRAEQRKLRRGIRPKLGKPKQGYYSIPGFAAKFGIHPTHAYFLLRGEPGTHFGVRDERVPIKVYDRVVERLEGMIAKWPKLNAGNQPARLHWWRRQQRAARNG